MYGKGRAIGWGLWGANLDEFGELGVLSGVRKGRFQRRDAKLAGFHGMVSLGGKARVSVHNNDTI